jgi:hypothetical protein
MDTKKEIAVFTAKAYGYPGCFDGLWPLCAIEDYQALTRLVCNIYCKLGLFVPNDIIHTIEVTISSVLLGKERFKINNEMLYKIYKILKG